MNSMTGFGRGEASNGSITVIVEMKSVNNRYRDVQVRLPRIYGVVEPRIQKALKDRFNRGRIDVFVRREVIGTEQTVRADPVLAEHYLQAAQEVSKRLARGGVDSNQLDSRATRRTGHRREGDGPAVRVGARVDGAHAGGR